MAIALKGLEVGYAKGDCHKKSDSPERSQKGVHEPGRLWRRNVQVSGSRQKVSRVHAEKKAQRDQMARQEDRLCLPLFRGEKLRTVGREQKPEEPGPCGDCTHHDEEKARRSRQQRVPGDVQALWRERPRRLASPVFDASGSTD